MGAGDLLIQGIGIVALFFILRSYQSKTRSEILGNQLVGSLIFVFHFACLFAWVGALTNVLVVLRNFVFDQKGKHAWASHFLWVPVFCVALAAIPILFPEGWVGLLPVISTIIGTYGRWRDNAAEIRVYALIGVVLWIPYTVLVGSISGTLTQVLVGAAILYGMWKHDGMGGVRVR